MKLIVANVFSYDVEYTIPILTCSSEKASEMIQKLQSLSEKVRDLSSNCNKTQKIENAKNEIEAAILKSLSENPQFTPEEIQHFEEFIATNSNGLQVKVGQYKCIVPKKNQNAIVKSLKKIEETSYLVSQWLTRKNKYEYAAKEQIQQEINEVLLKSSFPKTVLDIIKEQKEYTIQDFSEVNLYHFE